MSTIGVLALQGGFAAHARALEDLGHRAREVRTASALSGLDGLVLPGGESSVMLDLLARDGGALERGVGALVAAGAPLLATCAGLILAARSVEGPTQRSLDLLDVVVRRNAYGRQLASTTTLDDRGEHTLVLIRAPSLLSVGPGVGVLATLRGEPVLVRQGARIGATFHPELTRDRTIHRLAFGDARGADQGERVSHETREPTTRRNESAVVSESGAKA